MFNQEPDYLSVYISEQSIKVAQVKSSGAILKVARRDIAGATGDALIRELKAVLSGFNPKKTSILCVIPAGAATTKNIEVPSVDPEEIKSIINLQASRHTPFSRDEILVGYINLGSYQANYTKVLLVIVNRNVVKEKLNAFERAGLEVHQVAFAPEGIGRFYARALNLKRDSAPVGIIDVGAQSTNFIISARGAAVTCRSIPIGIRQLETQGAEARDKLVAEVKASLDSYREEDIDKLPDYFLLTSDHNVVKDLQPSLAQALNMAVQVSPFVDQLKIGGGLKKKLQKDFEDDSLADVIAPAASASRLEVNLMPEEIQLKRNLEVNSRDAMMSGVYVLMILIFVGAILLTKIYFKETFLKKNLRAKYAGQHEEVVALEEKMRKTKAVRDLLESRLAGMEVLRGLYAIIPNDIYINSLNVTEEGVVTVNGIAETTSRVYAFVSSLSESKSFDGVKTKSTSGKKDRGKDLVAFEIEFTFKNDSSPEDVPSAPKAKMAPVQAGVQGT